MWSDSDNGPVLTKKCQIWGKKHRHGAKTLDYYIRMEDISQPDCGGKWTIIKECWSTKGYKKPHNPNPCFTDEEKCTLKLGLRYSSTVVLISFLTRPMLFGYGET